MSQISGTTRAPIDVTGCGTPRIAEDFCAGCDATRTRPHLTLPTGRYVACTSCGLIRVDPLPFEDDLEARAEYWSERHHLRAEKLQRQFDPMFQRMAYGKVLRKLAPFHTAGGLLEIGCAAGAFLDAARRHGWQPTGVELAMSAAAYARDEHGLDVRAGTLANIDFDARQFDAVVMLDVIEHVFHPARLLEATRPLLLPGGALLLMTPNTRGLGARQLKSEWEAYTPDDHLWLFDRDTLAALCTRTGYRVRSTWTMDCNPLALLRALVPRRRDPSIAAQRTPPGPPAESGATPAPVSLAIQRRHRLLGALRASALLRGARTGANALLGGTDLGDKLYLLAERI